MLESSRPPIVTFTVPPSLPPELALLILAFYRTGLIRRRNHRRARLRAYVQARHFLYHHLLPPVVQQHLHPTLPHCSSVTVLYGSSPLELPNPQLTLRQTYGRNSPFNTFVLHSQRSIHFRYLHEPYLFEYHGPTCYAPAPAQPLLLIYRDTSPPLSLPLGDVLGTPSPWNFCTCNRYTCCSIKPTEFLNMLDYWCSA